MLTVTKLAKSCGLSRSTLLYYESTGLLKSAARTASNYRSYSQRDLDRLKQICAYRDAGLRISDIRALLHQPESGAASILKRRLLELDSEIAALRGHQHSILKLLQSKNSLRRNKTMTKEKWTSIMHATGFSEADMRRWHVEFERSAPADHQEFLEFLHIPATEIMQIREWSRKG
jgi:DNA-binding transcriptional MerR regulator